MNHEKFEQYRRKVAYHERKMEDAIRRHEINRNATTYGLMVKALRSLRYSMFLKVENKETFIINGILALLSTYAELRLNDAIK